MGAQQWYYAALGLAALVGMVVTLYKVRPESTRIYVDSAEVSVRLADASRDRLAKEVTEIKARLSAVEDQLRHEKDQRRMSNAYARTLAQVLREHDMAVPQPPVGLDLD